jgi:hypothetical protein
MNIPPVKDLNSSPAQTRGHFPRLRCGSAALLLAGLGWGAWGDRAGAATIIFTATDLVDSMPGQDLWEYSYRVSDLALAANQGFAIRFDQTLYLDLQSPPPWVNGAWNVMTLQPDLGLNADGLYDALALQGNPSLANSFSINFVWLGSGTPGAQPYEIYDTDFATLARGETVAPPPAALPAGCVAWWRAEGNFQDFVGTHPGAAMNGATFAAGAVGQSMSFDGSDDYVQVPDSADLNLVSGQGWTMEGWIKPGRVNQFIAHKGSQLSGEVPYWGVYVNERLLRFEMSSGRDSYDSVSSSSVVAVGQWQHVAVAVDNMGGPISGYHLYINGTDAGISYSHDGTSSGTVNVTEPLRIGVNMGKDGALGNFFDGLIDELAIYKRALTAAEIAALHAAGSSGKQTLVPPLITSSSPLAGGRVGTSYSRDLTASGGAAPYTWEISSGGLPPGLVLGTGGTITGKPNTAGTFTCTLRVAGSDGGAATADFSLTITPAPATVTLGGLAATYDGAPKPVTATTDPPGLAVRLSYDGEATPPTHAGSYQVVALVDNANFIGSTTGTLVLAKAVATLTLGDLAVICDGTPKVLATSTRPEGLAVTVTYDGAAAPPTAVGTYDVIATIEDDNYSGTARGTLAVGTAAVAFSPDAALLHPNVVEVTLTCLTPEAVIRYTLDGTVPNAGSTRYSAAFRLTHSAQVRARAFSASGSGGALSEATYLVGHPPSSGDGFLATYYDNMDFTGASLTRVDPTIDFNWGTGSPDPALGPDTFSVRWSGKLVPRFAESYVFHATTDEGCRLWLDLNRDGDFADAGEQVINDWSPHGETEVNSAPVALLAGQLYAFKLEMFENSGGAVARLKWSSFSEPKAIIPQAQAFSNAQFSQTVSTPVISPAGGTHTAAVAVTLASATTGTTLYYTTNGSIPDEDSAVYGAPFTLGADATVRARAYKAGFNPSGVASVIYHIDAQPPLITQLAWQDVALQHGETITHKGIFSAQATDNQGVAAAEFYYRPSGSATALLVGRDDTPADGLAAAWDIATISDGAYTVAVRVYDVAGTWSEVSREISVALARPTAPVIVAPLSGVTVLDPVVSIRISAEPFANIRLYRDESMVFSGYASFSGSFSYAPALPDGTSVFKAVAVNRAGESADSNSITVKRVREFPQFNLTFNTHTVTESDPVMGTVSIPAAEARDVTVQIGTNKASQMVAVNPLVIPAGATSATFTLSARQDSEMELLSTVLVTASAPEHRSAETELFLGDDDYPVLALTLDQSSVAESHGTVVGVIRRATASDRSLRVVIQNTNPAKAITPPYVDLAANQAEATFSITIVNDMLDDDNQIVKLRGAAFIGDTSVAQSALLELEVRDDDGPSLALELSTPFVSEGSAVNATVRRSGAANTAPLVLALSQSPSGQLSIPATVTIPAGGDQVAFSVAALNSAVVNGTRNLTLRATAAAFTDGLSQLTVTDESKAELTVSNLSAPGVGLTESYAALSYLVNNHGSVAAAGPFFERIYLSKDLSPGADDLLVRQMEQSGELAAGGHYTRNVSVLMPGTPGTYYLIVTVDPGNMVAELNEANNTSVLLQPVEVRAAYSATVQTAPEVVPTNTPILFAGTATKENGQPAGSSMVNIHIKLDGTTRIISAVTNALGQFSTTWTPLANEGGLYTIGATHPGTATAPSQDAFEILTMGLTAPSQINMLEAETVVVEATLRNPNGRALHGVAMKVSGAPAGLSITPLVSNTVLASGSSMQIPITVSARAGFSGNGAFPLTVTTTEGLTMQALMYVNISLLTPSLSFSVGNLDGSVMRGGSKSVSFTVTNNGGLETGPVQLLLPDLSWMSLACTSPLPSIPPGGSADVSLLLAPDASVPLTLHTGSMAINPANCAGRTLGYQFRVVSTLKGDLSIDVVDELYFFTAAAPKLRGAQVVVRDAISSEQVASITTGADGVAAFTALPEGWYRIEVSAAEHDSYSGNYYVNAGQNNSKQVFISKQLVKYSWKVEEVAVEDVYRVTVETKFETNVPAPVVTATPSALDISDLVALGQTKIINVTLENQGLIAAQNSMFVFTEHPFYSFTPLVANIGTIPAKSSLVVPVTVRRIGIFGDDGGIITEQSGMLGKMTMRGPAGETAVPCAAAASVDYDYPCGNWSVEKKIILAISGVQGSCGGGGSAAFSREILEFFSHGNATGGGTGDNSSRTFEGGIGTSNSYVYIASPDYSCLNACIVKATYDCVLSYLGLGLVYSTAQQLVSEMNSPNPPALARFAVMEYAKSKEKPIMKVLKKYLCLYKFIQCHLKNKNPKVGSIVMSLTDDFAAQFPFDSDMRNFAPDLADGWTRCEPILRMSELIYGTAELVAAHQTDAGDTAMLKYTESTLPTSDGGTLITSAESIEISGLSTGAGLDHSLVQKAIDRWNRTVDYYSRDIREIADVPTGQSTDFIDETSLRAAADAVIVSFNASQAKGFIDPLDELFAEGNILQQTLQGSQGGTCATVKIQLSQDVVMTRSAFRATLELENERSDGPVTQVGFDLQIRDELGLPSEDLFNVQVTKLTGLAAINGTGEIPSASSGSAQWTLIPRDTAAQEVIRHYTVGGVIHYLQNGTEFNIPVENVAITVRPDASLVVKYFHQRDVLSDDPHTDAIEPAIPYKLAAMVENNGHGEANNLRIISGQPQIVDNEKGLFIDFKVIATEVGGTPLSPSLTADFGTLLPGQRKIATWYLTSSLQGLFTDYKATFEHVSGLGDSRISLLESVEIHEMIRMVKAQGTRDDGSPDFLTNDVKDANDYPDTIHYSNGGTDLVTLRQTGSYSGAPAAGGLTVTLNTGAFSGWSYIRLPDPAMGDFRLVSATRSDGRILPMDFNVWQSNRTFIGGGRMPLYENILHLADNDSSGIYTLVYAPLSPSDSTPPNSFVNALPAHSSASIPVTWNGTDNQTVSHYDVYVSANGDAYSLWKDNTTELGALFAGSSGNTYRFYSIATDHAGNAETKDPVAEATTQVSEVNQPPVIAALENASVNEGDSFTLQAVASDPDGFSSSIRFSIGCDRPGVVIDPVSGVLRWNTSEADGGVVANVVVIATDSGFPAAVSNKAFSITVKDVNNAPTITQVGPQTIQSNGVLIVDTDAVDGDLPQQTLRFALTEAPAGATIDPNSGVINWQPNPAQSGKSHGFVVTVSDNGTPVRSASMCFSATVPGVTDRPPVFHKVPVVLWLKGKTYYLTVSAADPDGDPITLTANTAATAGAVFSDLGNGSGTLSWNTSGAEVASYSVPVTATAKGLSATATLLIKVASDELYWRWAKDAFGNLPDDYDMSLTDMDADPDGDGRGNVHEMAFLTDPLVADRVPLKIEIYYNNPFAVIQLNMHRRVGSEQYVDFDVASGTNLTEPWQKLSRWDWDTLIDGSGDDDGRAETEEIDFYLFELYPAGLPAGMFYRVESTKK